MLARTQKLLHPWLLQHVLMSTGLRGIWALRSPGDNCRVAHSPEIPPSRSTEVWSPSGLAMGKQAWTKNPGSDGIPPFPRDESHAPAVRQCPCGGLAMQGPCWTCSPRGAHLPHGSALEGPSPHGPRSHCVSGAQITLRCGLLLSSA